MQPLVAVYPKKRQWPGFSVMAVTSGSTWPVLVAAFRLPGRLTSGAQAVVQASRPKARATEDGAGISRPGVDTEGASGS